MKLISDNVGFMLDIDP